MLFFVDDHTCRCFGFNNGVFTEIEFLALSCPVLVGRYGIYYIALVITKCTIRCDNIFIGCNFINRPCKSFDLIYRLINHIFIFLAGYIDTKEYFAGFLNGNRTFLCHIRLVHLNQCDTTFLCRIFFCYIKGNRSTVEYISIRSLNLNK